MSAGALELERGSGLELEHGLYLLHFEPAYEHARHYLGYADSIPRRVREHFAGGSKASPLVRAALEAGSRVTVTRVWLGGSRDLERRLKRRGGLSSSCPTCLARELVPPSRRATRAAGRPSRGKTPPAEL